MVAPAHNGVSACSLTSCREDRCSSEGSESLQIQADVAQWESATMPRSRPRVRSPVSAPNLMAGVLRHHGHACAPQSAGATGMCAAGTPASCSESALWWFTPPSRWSTTAMRCLMKQTRAPVELTLRGRKSAATIGRHRNPSPDTSLGGCSSTGRAAALHAAGCRFDACHFHQT